MNIWSPKLSIGTVNSAQFNNVNVPKVIFFTSIIEKGKKISIYQYSIDIVYFDTRSQYECRIVLASRWMGASKICEKNKIRLKMQGSQPQNYNTWLNNVIYRICCCPKHWNSVKQKILFEIPFLCWMGAMDSKHYLAFTNRVKKHSSRHTLIKNTCKFWRWFSAG